MYVCSFLLICVLLSQIVYKPKDDEDAHTPHTTHRVWLEVSQWLFRGASINVSIMQGNVLRFVGLATNLTFKTFIFIYTLMCYISYCMMMNPMNVTEKRKTTIRHDLSLTCKLLPTTRFQLLNLHGERGRERERKNEERQTLRVKLRKFYRNLRTRVIWYVCN